MTICGISLKILILNVLILCAGIVLLWAQQDVSPTVPVRMTITVSLLGDNKRMPEVPQGQVEVKQGRDRVEVTEWTPARGAQAGLDLFILIDDASDSGLGSHLDDLRSFVNAQPQTTSVGIGYMRNTTVEMVQNFTTDHAQAAKTLRLPVGNTGVFGSPYLSAIDLMKRWPEHPNRREIVMISDGIDRARGGPRSRLSTITPDVNSASEVAQRTGTLIHTIYFPGVGRLHRNFWEANNGENGMAKLSDETGGESFFLSFQRPVSLKPYLDDIQKILENQYWLGFRAKPGNNEGLQNMSVDTDVAGVELVHADGVWVPASK